MHSSGEQPSHIRQKEIATQTGSPHQEMALEERPETCAARSKVTILEVWVFARTPVVAVEVVAFVVG